jgi:hypothetical protein
VCPSHSGVQGTEIGTAQLVWSLGWSGVNVVVQVFPFRTSAQKLWFFFYFHLCFMIKQEMCSELVAKAKGNTMCLWRTRTWLPQRVYFGHEQRSANRTERLGMEVPGNPPLVICRYPSFLQENNVNTCNRLDWIR